MIAEQFGASGVVERWPQWWQEAELRRWRTRNRPFAGMTFWLKPKISAPAPVYRRIFSGRHSRQAFLFYAWLYEFDARMRGQHIFGGAVCTLGEDALTAILRASHPMKGVSEKWAELVGTDTLPSVLLQNDPVAGGGDIALGYTPWRYVARRNPARKSRFAVSFNLYASDRAIEEEWRLRETEIGVEVGRDKLRGLLKEMRSEFAVPPPKKEAPKNGRTAKLPWELLEPMREHRAQRKLKFPQRYASGFSRAKRIYRLEALVIESWVREARAGVGLASAH